MKTIKFYTIGCKVNQYETQAIRERFIERGFKEINGTSPADIYIINTCTVTQKADRDSRHLIYSAHHKNPRAKIVVTGCYTELDSEEIDRIPGVTHIVKNRDKHKIHELLNGQNEHNEPNEHNESGIPNAVNTSSYTLGSRRDTEAVTTFGISFFQGHSRAFLKIQDGCDNLCSYCKVPLVRGRLRSRPLNEIVQEVERLIKNGFKEIVLSGICLGAYGKDLDPRIDLADVLKRLEKIDGFIRLRLSSIEAWDITQRLINMFGSSKRICPHLHIPIQSGDDTILNKMNRKMRAGDYLKIINRLKKTMPSLAITTDVIVGFPGEKEENFLNTLELVRKIEPLKVHIFPYSPRALTPAFYLKVRVSDNEIKKRVSYLRDIARECAFKYRSRFLNQSCRILIEGNSKKDKGFQEGLTDNYIRVRLLDKRDLKNEFRNAVLKEIKEDFALGELANQS